MEGAWRGYGGGEGEEELGKTDGEARSRHVRSRPYSRRYAYPQHNTVPITTSTAITIPSPPQPTQTHSSAPTPHIHRQSTDTCTYRHIPAAVSFLYIASICPQIRVPSASRLPLTMDAYPPELVAHETPLLLVSGLGTPEQHLDVDAHSTYGYPQLAENGARVTSSAPPVTTPAGELLLLHFLRADSAGIWSGRTADKLKSQTPAWRVRAVGRVETPPPPPRPELPRQ